MPIFYGFLILRPIFLGGGLFANHFEAAKFIPPIATAEAANLPVKTEKTIDTRTVWVTAYSSSPNETDDTPLITATNKKVQDGFLAANFLPFGTKVKIPALFGDKIFVVEDRMSRRKVDFVDVWMPAKEDALEFGIHQTEIEIVEMGTIPNPLVATIPENENSAQD